MPEIFAVKIFSFRPGYIPNIWQTKIKLSDLDDQLFNGLRNLRDEKDKLSAEIALQDGILVYLRENTVKITDSDWTELLEMRDVVENLNQNTDSIQTRDVIRIITYESYYISYYISCGPEWHP